MVPAGILSRFEIKNKEVASAELFLGKIIKYAGREKKFVQLPQYPAIARDISLAIKEEVSAEELLAEVKLASPGLLQAAEIIDYYKGKQVPTGYKGLTISCLYRSDARTLTEEEIIPLYTALKSRLAEKFGAQFR